LDCCAYCGLHSWKSKQQACGYFVDVVGEGEGEGGSGNDGGTNVYTVE